MFRNASVIFWLNWYSCLRVHIFLWFPLDCRYLCTDVTHRSHGATGWTQNLLRADKARSGCVCVGTLPCRKTPEKGTNNFQFSITIFCFWSLSYLSLFMASIFTDSEGSCRTWYSSRNVWGFRSVHMEMQCVSALTSNFEQCSRSSVDSHRRTDIDNLIDEGIKCISCCAFIFRREILTVLKSGSFYLQAQKQHAAQVTWTQCELRVQPGTFHSVTFLNFKIQCEWTLILWKLSTTLSEELFIVHILFLGGGIKDSISSTCT